MSELPKAEWPAGPWHDEPDHVEFQSAGFPCILHRNSLGAWCGYVGVPKGHPWHGIGYDDVLDKNGERPDVHGGLTYAEPCQGSICHVGEPDDHRYWLGFDCRHLYDLVPGMAALREKWRREDPAMAKYMEAFQEEREFYRDIHYAKAETEKLATQAKEAAG